MARERRRAGVLASAAVFVDLPPVVRWGAAVILGSGAGGVVQAGTVVARLKSSLFTGGAGNIVELSSIHSPPNHPSGTVHKTKAETEADASEH